jgi:VanZ family protein
MVKIAAFLFLLLLGFVFLAADMNALPAGIRALYRFPRGDLVGHFVLYGGLAFLFAAAYPRRIPRARLAWTSVLAMCLALAEELSQYAFPGRTPSVLDVACGLLGVLVGDSLARLRQRTGARS